MIYFLDLEASSLSHDSFPIEVAWVNGDGQGESYLIRPADEWLDPLTGLPDWSAASERVHRISLRRLEDEGKPHDWVARRAAGMLASRRVIVASNAREFDEAWTTRLLWAGGVRQRIEVVDVDKLYGFACRPLFALLPPWEGSERERAEDRVRAIAREIVTRAEEAEAMRPRVTHRALPDAESLWRTWRAVRDGVADHLARKGVA